MAKPEACKTVCFIAWLKVLRRFIIQGASLRRGVLKKPAPVGKRALKAYSMVNTSIYAKINQ